MPDSSLKAFKVKCTHPCTMLRTQSSALSRHCEHGSHCPQLCTWQRLASKPSPLQFHSWTQRKAAFLSFLLCGEKHRVLIGDKEGSPSSHQDQSQSQLGEWHDKPEVKALLAGLHLVLWKIYCALKNQHIGSSIIQEQRTKLLHSQPVKPLVSSNELQQLLSCFFLFFTVLLMIST